MLFWFEMLGIIRFILAMFVLVSHLPHLNLAINLGVIAVICFYFISGYLMTNSYKRFVHLSNNPVRKFYIDRALKLLPLYFSVLSLTIFFIWLLGDSELFPILNQDLSYFKILLNILVFPNNYVFEPFAIGVMLPHPLVPPSWSLATEMHFYILLPFVWILKKKSFLVLLLIFLNIQFLSFFFDSGWFNSNNIGYRFIFCVFNVFLYGIAFARYNDIFYKRLVWSIWLYFLSFFIVAHNSYISNPWVYEILIGGVMALIIGLIASRNYLFKEYFFKIDRFFGGLAYPIFLNHFLAFFLVEKVFNYFYVSNDVMFFITSILFSIGGAIILSYIQQKIETYRFSMRGFISMRDISNN